MYMCQGRWEAFYIGTTMKGWEVLGALLGNILGKLGPNSP